MGPGGTRWMWWLLVCVVGTQTALNVARPLLSYRAIALGGDALAIGLITSAYALLSLIVAVPLGRLADRMRAVHRLVLAGVVLLAVAPLLMAAASSLPLVGAAGTVLGFGHVVFMIAGQGIVARRSAEADLDRNFGWFTAAVSLGQMAGPLIAGLILGDAQGAQLYGPTTEALVAASGAALLGVAGVAGLRRASAAPAAGSASAPTAEPRTAGAKVDVPSLLRRPGVGPGLFVSLALLASVDLLTAYLPLVAEERGVSPAVAGALLALRAGLSIASRLMLGRLVARFSRRGLIVTGTAGSAVCLAVVALPLGSTIWPMAIALAVGGFLLGIGQPLTMTSVVKAVPTEARTTALALRIWANRMGQVALPAAAGALAASLGAAGAMWFAGAVLTAAAGTAPFMSADDPVPGEDRPSG